MSPFASARELWNSTWCAIALQASVGATACVCCGAHAAESYPTRPLRLIVATSPASAADIVARILAEGVGRDLGQQIIIDNRAGAGGNLGAEIASRAPNDGHTLFFATPAHAINSALKLKPSYDFRRDFAPISQVSSGMYVLVVHPSIAARSVRDLVALAKAKPASLNYVSGGLGNATHLAVELFKRQAGVDIVHVPYQGAGPALTALIGGESQVGIQNLTAVLPHVNSGRLAALAVTSRNRSTLLPQVPTLIESGVRDYEVTAWFGVAAPRGVDRARIAKLNAAIVKAVHAPTVLAALARDGALAVGGTPEAFTTFIEAEVVRWRQAMRDAKIDPQ